MSERGLTARAAPPPRQVTRSALLPPTRSAHAMIQAALANSLTARQPAGLTLLKSLITHVTLPGITHHACHSTRHHSSLITHHACHSTWHHSSVITHVTMSQSHRCTAQLLGRTAGLCSLACPCTCCAPCPGGSRWGRAQSGSYMGGVEGRPGMEGHTGPG